MQQIDPIVFDHNVYVTVNWPIVILAAFMVALVVALALLVLQLRKRKH